MGNFIVDCCRNTDCEVVGGYDIVAHPTIPTFTSVSDISVDFDVIVDFSRACLLSEVVKLAKATKKGVVLATTGYSEEDEKVISDLSTFVPVLRSGNMSVGVNLLLSLVETATKALADKFDIEIIEKHHNQKADAPSGTALMLANEVKKIKTDAKYLYGRQGESKREKEDVTIHAVRGGTIVGEHDVIFAGNDEIITLSHTALSTATPGLYSMKNAL